MPGRPRAVICWSMLVNISNVPGKSVMLRDDLRPYCVNFGYP